ncbi:MAG: pilus assembly protein TadG-related protein [Candidatus Limnocylindrales bacterium]
MTSEMDAGGTANIIPRLLAEEPGGEAGPSVGVARRRRQASGQTLVMFVVAIIVLLGFAAIVIDVSWYWVNTLRIQRAADAAALAGAVQLPNDPTTGMSLALKEAEKNGYGDGVSNTSNGQTGPCTLHALTLQVCAHQDSTNDHQMDVTIAAAVPTFFMRIFGIQAIQARQDSEAQFTLPVPMGSPQNYYGVGYFVSNNTGWHAATTQPSSTPPSVPPWTTPGNADGTYDQKYATATGNSVFQQWGAFGLQSGILGIQSGDTVDGLEVQLTGKRTGSGCTVQVAVSWNGGTTWSPTPPTSAATVTLTTSENTYTLGSQTSLSTWSGHAWTYNDFSDSNFRVRLTTASCAGQTANIDTLQVRISYSSTGAQPIYDPYGTTLLTPQYFWGAQQSEGAPNIQGDAYMTKYQSRSGLPLNTDYDPTNYYNYGIDIPPGAINGEVWIFDPGFCEVSTSLGTGEDWTVGSPNGYASAQPASTFFDLYNTNGTPYNLGDDTLIASTNNTFKDFTGDDASLGGTHGSIDCSSASWHNSWWKLASGLTGGTQGTTYRLHTYSTDPSNSTEQDNTTALNAFSFWVKSSGGTGTPRVYGLGSMEGYFRVPGGQASTFYLAQVAQAYAGKTLEIDLWDPGDTGALSASLAILEPTTTGYQAAPFSYSATQGSSDANTSSCNSRAGTGVTSVTTNTGNNSLFNGCWVTIDVALANNYAAPQPPGEPAAGWWKIQYTMGGSASNFATDLTTWKVQIVGNPVHLVVP